MTLKSVLTKYHQEAQAPWIDLLSTVLLKVQSSPGPTEHTPFEVLYGRSLPLEVFREAYFS